MVKKLKITALILTALTLSACAKSASLPESAPEIAGLTFKERAELEYADKFTVDRYEGGYSLISVADGGEYLIVPEGADAPETDAKIIERGTDNIYLASTAAMSMFDALGCGGKIRFSATKADDWYIDYAKDAMAKGDMVYAGKYSEPDYELLLSENCPLSIQSTMIGHAPEVREKLEELGIKVFVDYSSYETHPLGRSEWVKLYGEMMGESEKADELFDAQTAYLDAVSAKDSGKTVVFFYISEDGRIYTRKSGDYITKMIELAGGENILKGIGDEESSSSVTIEPEEFYERARDADVIIYNATVGGKIRTMDELTAKNSLLDDFKAVKSGDVWCMDSNLFQETLKTGEVISDFNAAFTGGETRYLYKVESSGGDE